MKQTFNLHSATDKDVWQILFNRQKQNLTNKGSGIFLQCLENMHPVLNANQLPDFTRIGNWFQSRTGWSIVEVPGLIPVTDFFRLLANKQFCSSTWVRRPEQLDYLKEPDMFHDIFGHVPLLSDPVFSAFMQKFGELGLNHASNKEIELQLQRLYWFTIEFGVIQEDKLRSYGAGILSSFGETNHVNNGGVVLSPFSLETIVSSDFRTDAIQQHYFVLESFQQLFESLHAFESILNTTRKPNPKNLASQYQ
ncbi:MAG: hypothetical protein QM534_02710 [Sediminibacterium sp.]|nr:hypothetical protein [Sediminibacterium sp.]